MVAEDSVVARVEAARSNCPSLTILVHVRIDRQHPAGEDDAQPVGGVARREDRLSPGHGAPLRLQTLEQRRQFGRRHAREERAVGTKRLFHGATLIEDAAESLGATYDGVQTGTFGDYSAISLLGVKRQTIDGPQSLENRHFFKSGFSNSGPASGYKCPT